jgi:propanol-preferring alcohol dehydrogenase
MPIIPGHEIVATVEAVGSDDLALQVGQRVGVPWLGYSCGGCRYCRRGRENLCESARYTGYQIDGGYAEFTVADARYCFPLPERYDDVHSAPLLCAGLIGHRSYRMAGEAETLGLYGFGAAAHIVAQIARFEGKRVFAFTRPSDSDAQAFARRLGAEWAGGADENSPVPLDAAIIFAPSGELVPQALRQTTRGATIVCAGIHMSNIPSFPYEILWHERMLRSVANLTRDDAREFLRLAPQAGVQTHTETYPLAAANQALADLRHGRFSGAAVLVPPS